MFSGEGDWSANEFYRGNSAYLPPAPPLPYHRHCLELMFRCIVRCFTDLEANEGKDDVQRHTEASPGIIQTGVTSHSNVLKMEVDPAYGCDDYAEIDENILNIPKSRDVVTSKNTEGQNCEDLPDNKTNVFFTLEPESVSSDAVTSQQHVSCNQLQQDGPIGEAVAEATKVTGYDYLPPTTQKTAYDNLIRVKGRVKKTSSILMNIHI